MEQLSPDQLKIVRHPHDKNHLLVLAAPGSGKTRVITERVGSLLTRRLATPEQVLVMTFTIKAAKELYDRLERRLDTHAQGLWAGTFHSICDRLLHDHGKAIGWAPPFTIYDVTQQEIAVRRAALQIGLVLDEPKRLREVRDRISLRKRRGIPGDQQDPTVSDPNYVLAIDDAYRQMLTSERALDYDDLIMKGIQILEEDVEAATIVRNRFQYVFVDEFHDLSVEQSRLLHALAPPRSPDHHVMVVADSNQAIYSWRQADAQRMLQWYSSRYKPITYALVENYRSAGNLVRAAQHLITAGGASANATATVKDGNAIDCVACPTPEEEARWLAKQIERAHATGRYRYSDMAVLYRTHKRADLAETTLLQAGIPLTRVQPERLFNDPDVQATLRYLALIAALQDESFEPALNWPRVLVDELTMVHLRRLAQTSGCSLSLLAKYIDSYAEHISPLTRVAITDFLTTLNAELLPVADDSIGRIVQALLTVLHRRRSPIAQTIRESMKGVLDYLTQFLEQPVEYLYQTVCAGRAIAIRYDGGIDTAAAGLILHHVLTHYLRATVDMQTLASPVAAGSFVIQLGEPLKASEDGFSLTLRDVRTIQYSVSTLAWRLGQMLLMRYETLRYGHFMLYDLETTGHHANTTEILELAALEMVEGRPSGRTFQSMVRPKGIISSDATKVHHITFNDVRNAPVPSHILPQFLGFLNDTTLVGHNIEQFDHPVLRRVAQNCGLEPPNSPLIDTCTLARRLLPGAAHGLEELAHRFGIQVKQSHRALDDIQLNARVFNHLLDLLDRERELDVASEVLPLVALGITASKVPLKDENVWLFAAGARALHRGLGQHLTEYLPELISDRSDLEEVERQLRSQVASDSEDDERWEKLASHLEEMITQYRRVFSDHSLQAFLHYTALAAPIDYQADDDRVTMMTIHTAKGMEWPLVFLIGAEHDMLPAWFVRTDEERLEERRVLYVAMTRAKQRLLISWSERLDGRAKRCSPFLEDLPDDLASWWRWQARPKEQVGNESCSTTRSKQQKFDPACPACGHVCLYICGLPVVGGTTKAMIRLAANGPVEHHETVVSTEPVYCQNCGYYGSLQAQLR